VFQAETFKFDFFKNISLLFMFFCHRLHRFTQIKTTPLAWLFM